MTNQDFLNELDILESFYLEVKKCQLKNGVTTSTPFSEEVEQVVISGITSTAKATIALQYINNQKEYITKDQLLSESIVYQLNEIWDRYVKTYLKEHNKKKYSSLFIKKNEKGEIIEGTDYEETFELRKLTNCLKHTNRKACRDLAGANPQRFTENDNIRLSYQDAERYIDIVKSKMEILGG